jgi:hypothetical protein
MDELIKKIGKIIDKSEYSAEKIIEQLTKEYSTKPISKKRTKKRKTKVCRPPLYISDSSTDHENN